jgi:hypothetical protein
VLDIVKAASETPYVIFLSTNPQYELIDFLYQDGDGTFHAFQATISAEHSADPTKSRHWRKQLVVGKIKFILFGPCQTI